MSLGTMHKLREIFFERVIHALAYNSLFSFLLTDL